MRLHVPLRREDLIIPLDQVDSAALLADWRWLVQGRVRPVLLTMFGDWFLERENGDVEFLDLLEGQLTRVAGSIRELEALLDEEKLQDQWLLGPTIVALHARRLRPGVGECYGYKLPPIVGGSVEIENIEVLFLTVWQSIMGQIHQQSAALPEGTRISEFKNKPTP
jgi:hypothetical protein